MATIPGSQRTLNLTASTVATYATVEAATTITAGTLLIGTTGITAGGKVTSVTAGTANTDAVNVQQLNDATTGVLVYQGVWNANTNSPALASGVGTPGYYYIVDTDGATNLDGITDWKVGDWAVFSDLATDAWQKIDNTSILGGAGTGGNLAAWTGSGTSLTLGNAPITYSGNNVVAAGALDVTGVVTAGYGTAALPAYAFSTDSNTGMYRAGTDMLGFTTSGVEKMRIISNGNVGIGTTGPSVKLDVNGGGRFNTTTGATPFYITRNGANDQALKIHVDDAAVVFESIQDESVDNYGSFIFNMDSGTTEPYFDIRKGISESGTILRVDGSGNVGIGTTSPTEKLTVKGDNAGISLRSNDYMISRIIPRGSNTSNLDKGLFSLYNASVESTRIDSAGSSWLNGGNVGIGTTSPGTKLEVDGVITIAPSSSNVAELKGLYGTSFLSMDFMLFDNKLFGNAIVQNQMMQTMVFNDGSGEGMRLSQGKLGIGTTTPNSKLTIEGTESGLVKINNESGEDYFVVSQSASNKPTITFGDVDEQYGTMFNLDVESKVVDIFNNGVIRIGDNGFGNNTLFTVDDVNRKFTFENGAVGVGTTTPRAKLDVAGGIRMANETATATAANVGTMRYRVVNTRSYMDMCMQVGTSSYAWVNVVMNQW